MITKTLLLYFLLFLTLLSHSQEKSLIDIELGKLKNNKDKVAWLIKTGDSLLEKDLYKAEKCFIHAKKLLDENDLRNKVLITQSLGNVSYRKGNYTESLLSYFDSKEIYKKLKDTTNVAVMLLKEGNVYKYLRDNDKALKNYKKSFKLALKLQDSLLMGRCYNYMAGSYRRLKKIDSSFFYYYKALTIFKEIKNEIKISNVNNDLAILYGGENRFDKALNVHLNNIEFIKKNHSKTNIATTYFNISYSYFRLKEYDKCLNYLDSSFFIASKEGFKYRISRISDIRSAVYAKKKDYKKAYDYYVSYKKYSDSIFDLKKQKQIKELELKNEFESERKELESIATREEVKSKLYLMLFMIVITLGLIISYLIWKDYVSRTQIVNDKYEKEKLKKQVLIEQVKVSETELKYLIADNTMRLEFIKQLSKQIRKDKNSNNYKSVQEFANTLLLKLQQQITTENKLTLVQDKINDVNKVFEEKIKKEYPSLTKTEREMCSFLRLNLSIKEIASIRNSSIDSIKALRYRIRKKMQIPKNEELEHFVQAI